MAMPFNENENEELMAFWDDGTMPIPPIYCPVVASSSDGEETEIDADERDGRRERLSITTAFYPPPVPSFETNFEEESRSVTLLINRVPKELIMKQKQMMEVEIQEEKERNAVEFQRKESDIIWREHLARQRIIQVENSTRTRLNSEREKSLLAVDEKEKKIGRDFRRARENLEAGVKRQLISIQERFGEILIAGASLARKYGVQSTYAPQPVEVRVHFLRALKTKLPKGKYVMMLTQYENLGGNPIGWSKVGAYGERSRLDTDQLCCSPTPPISALLCRRIFQRCICALPANMLPSHYSFPFLYIIPVLSFPVLPFPLYYSFSFLSCPTISFIFISCPFLSFSFLHTIPFLSFPALSFILFLSCPVLSFPFLHVIPFLSSRLMSCDIKYSLLLLLQIYCIRHWKEQGSHHAACDPQWPLFRPHAEI